MTITIEIRGLEALQQKMKSLGMLKGIDARVGNNTIYAPWVGSARFQARVHRGRWTTDEQAIESNLDDIREDFQTAVNAAIGATVIRRNPLFVAAKAAVLRLQAAMARYPASTGGSYVRTGTYGRRWTTEVKEA